MGKTPTFCHHQEDLDGCRSSLVNAWCEGSVGKHCIMEGLRADWHQCRQVLLEGLKSRTYPRRGTGGPAAKGGQDNDVHEACKAVTLLGYPMEVKAIQDTFYEAYYKLVRSIIHKFGIRDDGDPSADDVFQNVFTSLHKQFRREASVKRPLAAYVAKVAVNECFRSLKNATGRASLAEEQVQTRASRPSALLPPPVVENWEHLDHRLLRSEQGNLINRIILAQQCLEACCTAKKPSAKQLKTDWQILARVSERNILSLHEKTAMYIRRARTGDVVQIAADLINARLAEPYQVAIVFAAATGIDLRQTHELIDQLSGLSDTAIFTRICRIYSVLKPPGMEEQ